MNKFDRILDFIKSLYPGKNEIPLHAPVFRGNEEAYIKSCIESTFVSSVGKYVSDFEEKMAEYTGSKKAVVCVNGTSALHMALLLAGVKPGHEVITQPLTFVATSNAISYCGAYPVYIDVDIDTMGLSAESLSSFIERNTTFNAEKNCRINKVTGRQVTACLPMHTFGHPCKIDTIAEICEKYNIKLVEDAAESVGSFYKGRHTGTFGGIGVLSFNGNKILTTGGGGMILFKDEELAIKGKHLTTQAKTPHPWELAHDETGYNYRMPNLNAALGLAQLEQLDNFINSKRELAFKYRDFFRDSNLHFVDEPPSGRSNFWLNTVLFKSKPERDEFLRYSNERKIMTRPPWQLMNKLPMFSKCQHDDLRNSVLISERAVNLPSSVR